MSNLFCQFKLNLDELAELIFLFEHNLEIKFHHIVYLFVCLFVYSLPCLIRAFSSNFGKRPLAKIGKNDRLNIKKWEKLMT